jgi:addiction module HigA family antidote
MYKRSPTHPGGILREDILPILGTSIAELSEHLGVTRKTLDAVLTERSAVTPEFAQKLGTFLGNRSQLWIEMQSKHDL